ncbi:xylose isomerase-like protein [Biscogniauxia mediterranea]|nr:xylose isomerase-like protein [Biscogniauxia mediterranea]
MGVYEPAIFSISLGRAVVHSLDLKIDQAAAKGFKGIELAYEDLEFAAKTSFKTDEPSLPELSETAAGIRRRCDSVGLKVITLQPFLGYDGLLDRDAHALMIEKIHVWFQLAKILGTDMILVPANFLPADQVSGDMEVIAADLRELADLGLREDPPVRFAYESLCWSTHVDTWEAAWAVVQRVDRPNFGLCLDTFNIAGRVWADPAAPDGRTPDADMVLRKSLERLVRDVDVRKVFFLQVVDAEKMDAPLVKGHPFHVAGQPPRMNWSRNARTFMYEQDRGAYLPVEKVADVIFNRLGYRGWVSMELFSRTLFEKGPHVVEDHAKRGFESWKKLQAKFHLDQR